MNDSDGQRTPDLWRGDTGAVGCVHCVYEIVDERLNVVAEQLFSTELTTDLSQNWIPDHSDGQGRH
jgi:hypothetical protein